MYLNNAILSITLFKFIIYLQICYSKSVKTTATACYLQSNLLLHYHLYLLVLWHLLVLHNPITSCLSFNSSTSLLIFFSSPSSFYRPFLFLFSSTSPSLAPTPRSASSPNLFIYFLLFLVLLFFLSFFLQFAIAIEKDKENIYDYLFY